MSNFLDGIAIQFYRGLGPKVQFIAPFSKMNIFIGPNNSGKSAILNLLSLKLSGWASNNGKVSLSLAETYLGGESGQFLMSLGVSKSVVVKSVLKRVEANRERQTGMSTAITGDVVGEILDHISTHGLIWVNQTGGGDFSIFPETDPGAAKAFSDRWQLIWSALTLQGGGSPQLWIRETLKQIATLAVPGLPKVYLIPAKRQLGAKGDSFDDLSGRGLIDHLAMLQNPDFDRQQDREKFKLINSFLREITGKADALLEVPNNREHLLVHMDNKVLPLSSLGTGIHEVVLIASFCTIHDGSLMCIEEPEVHLHPILQKKLVNYLSKKTSSQYFIATHSPVFIDTPNSSIFHVFNDGSQTYVKPALSKNGQREILDDLGCRASDILQANAIIWVEGPSDRIYVNHWIQSVDESLREGVHYTVMFFGGSLISHLTASDEAIDEFIKLRDLNRNMAILADSDRDSESAEVKPNVLRLRDEMNRDSSICWITAGREVENYIDGIVLQAAVKRVHPLIYREAGRNGQYDYSYHFWRDDSGNPGRRKTEKNVDKVGVAKLLCMSEADLDVLDLRDRVRELVSMIKKANGLVA